MQYLFPVAGYLIGSISAAILVCRIAGLPDPRTQGSGNPGATNVLRVGGKVPAAVTLLGDALKGFIPVIVASAMDVAPLWVGLTAIAAVLGHLFPVFFQFRGGKGVATAYGAIFGISWLTGLLVIASWLAVSLTFRYSSLAALTSMVLLPLYLWITTRSMELVVCGALIGVMIFWRHRANIGRLLSGSEPKIGDKKKS
jgi:glycerol-3-phosphate acyltransferase PlsY